MKIKHILAIGGDSRIDYLIKDMAKDGYCISGFSNEETLKGALEKCDCVLIGAPSTRDENTINAPNLKNEILIKDLMRLIGDKLLLAGKMTNRMIAMADAYNVHWIDYFMREEFEQLNAVPTAEGAIKTAMDELCITLFESKAIVTGYGRTARLIARYLKGFGCDVSICARSLSALSQARCDGYKTMDFYSLAEYCDKADVLFNTVPHTVIGKRELKKMGNTLIIDVASKPGGVDMAAAQEYGVNVIWALGIPGKYSPVSAGKIIKETIYNIFDELGE